MSKLRITLCASRGWTVSYSCINTKSAWRSAADVKVLLTSSIFLPVRSRPPCCNTPHNIQLCRLKGVESRAPPGHRPPDTCAYESQQQCQHHHQHASYSCLTHACKTKLSVCTQSRSGLRIYYPRTAKWPWWQKCSPLHFEATVKHVLHEDFLGVSDWYYASCNVILFDWMHQVQIGFPLTPPPVPA